MKMTTVAVQSDEEVQAVATPPAAKTPINLNERRKQKEAAAQAPNAPHPAAETATAVGTISPAAAASQAAPAMVVFSPRSATDSPAQPKVGGLKLTCLQTHLAPKLKLVQKAVATKTTLPVLNTILFEVSSGRLRLRGTNLELGLTTYLPAQLGSDTGDLCLPAALVTELIGEFPDDGIKLVELNGHQLHITCGDHDLTISGLAAVEFPIVPTAEKLPLVATVQAKYLRAALKQAEPFASADDTRPVLTAVAIDFLSDSLKLTAADGFSLAVRTVPAEVVAAQAVDKKGNRLQIDVPANTLKVLVEVLPEDGTVAIHVAANGSGVVFSHEEVELHSRLIEGPYPDISKILRDQHTTICTVNVAELQKALRIGEKLARASSYIVKLVVTPDDPNGLETGKIVIQAKGAEVGSVQSVVHAHVEGEPLTIALDVRRLLKETSLLTTRQVSIGFADRTGAAVSTELDGSDVVVVVMPMHLPEDVTKARETQAQAQPAEGKVEAGSKASPTTSVTATVGAADANLTTTSGDAVALAPDGEFDTDPAAEEAADLDDEEAVDLDDEDED